MYKGFKIIVKGQAREIESLTNEPFKWFPELEKLFENFKIKNLEFDVDVPEDRKDEVTRIIFKIVKVG